MKRLVLFLALLSLAGLISCGKSGSGKITSPKIGGDGQWARTTGFGATTVFGFVNGIASVGNIPVLFVGTRYSGAYRSTNGGTSWVPIGMPGNWVFDFSVGPTSICAGTAFGGPYTSTDNGTTWTGGANLEAHSIAHIGTTLFAGTVYGVYRSTNDGIDWVAVPANSGVTSTYVASLAVKGTTLFVGTDRGGLYRILDAAGTAPLWEPVGLAGKTVVALAVSGTRLTAVYGNSWNGTDVSYSDNDGGIWHSSEDPIPAGDYVTALQGRTMVVMGTSVFVARRAGGVFVSTNGGQNWSDTGSGLIDVVGLGVCGRALMAGTASGGLFRSEDNGRTWTQLNTASMTMEAITTLATSSDGKTAFAVDNLNGVFAFSESGTQWRPNNPNAFIGGEALAVSGDAVFVTKGSDVYRSLNGGDFQQIGRVAASISALAIFGQTMLAGTWSYGDQPYATRGVWLSTNGGVNFTQVGFMNDVKCLAVVGDFVLAGAVTLNGGASQRQQAPGVYRSSSSSGFTDWTSAPALPGKDVLCMAVVDGTVFAGTNDSVWRSTNQGGTWTQSSNGMASEVILSLAVGTNAVGTKVLFAGTQKHGVFRSIDNGASWTQFSRQASGVLPGEIPSVTVAGTSVFAGCGGLGVWKTPAY